MTSLGRGLVPPKPSTGNPQQPFYIRLRRGFHSWLALLGHWDYRLPLGSLRFLGHRLFVVNAPELVRQVLVEQVELFPKHRYTAWTLKPLIGEAIFAVNGQQWQQQRRLLDPAFQAAALQRALPLMAQACRASLQRLSDQVGVGKEIDIDQEMTLLAADVILRTLTATPLAPQQAGPIFAAFALYQRRAARGLVWRLLRCPKSWLEPGLHQAAAPIRRWISEAVAAQLAMADPPATMLQALIDARDPATGASFDEGALVDQLCFLFLAGHETSASALAMALYLLSECPELQAQLRQERQGLLVGEQQSLRFADLRQLHWHTAVFNETLRLYPPVSFFIREAMANSDIGGQRCPMASLLTLSPWLIHRHHNHWPDPDQFIPERFLPSAPEREQRLAREAFLPYGLGPRKCPGAAFAQQEAVLVLAELLAQFALEPAADHEPRLTGRLTLRSSNGIRVQLLPLRTAG